MAAERLFAARWGEEEEVRSVSELPCEARRREER
jgi:hypothetical protein